MFIEHSLNELFLPNWLSKEFYWVEKKVRYIGFNGTTYINKLKQGK